MKIPTKLMRHVVRAISVIVLAFSAIAHADAGCRDRYQFVLGVQLEADGYWLSDESSGALPIRHASFSNILLLAVSRIDDRWLQVNASAVAGGRAYSWQAQIEMDRSAPTRYTRIFRPAPDMPMFAIEISPACVEI